MSFLFYIKKNLTEHYIQSDFSLFNYASTTSHSTGPDSPVGAAHPFPSAFCCAV